MSKDANAGGNNDKFSTHYWGKEKCDYEVKREFREFNQRKQFGGLTVVRKPN